MTRPQPRRGPRLPWLVVCGLCLPLLLGRAWAASKPSIPVAPITVTLTRCGALGPAKEAAPPALVPQTGPLPPTAQGLGCGFVVAGGAPNTVVLLEVRLTRPSLAGQGQAVDRWFVPARPGVPGTVRHIFALPRDTMPGDWELALYHHDRRLADHRFTLAAATPEQAPQPPQSAEPDKPAATTIQAVPTAPAPQPASRPAEPEVKTETASPPQPAPAAPHGSSSMRARVRTTEPSPPVRTTPPPAPARPSTPAARPPAPAPTAPAPAPARTATPPAPNRATRHPVAPPAHAQAPARPAEPGPAGIPGTTKTPTTGYFALQTGLFADPANADNQATRLRARGLPACIVEETTEAGKRYRVLAGRFGDQRAARLLRPEVIEAVGGRALVRQVTPETAARLRCQ